MTRTILHPSGRTTFILIAMAACIFTVVGAARATDKPLAPVEDSASAGFVPVEIEVVELRISRLEDMMRTLRRMIATQTVGDFRDVIDEASMVEEIAELEALRAAWSTATPVCVEPKPTPDSDVGQPQPAGTEAEPASGAEGPESPVMTREVRNQRLSARIRLLSAALRKLQTPSRQPEIGPDHNDELARLWDEAASIETELNTIARVLSVIEVQMADVSELVARYEGPVATNSPISMNIAELRAMADRFHQQFDELWRDNEVAFAAASELGIIANEMQDVELALEAKRLGFESAATRRRIMHDLDTLSSLVARINRL